MAPPNIAQAIPNQEHTPLSILTSGPSEPALTTAGAAPISIRPNVPDYQAILSAPIFIGQNVTQAVPNHQHALWAPIPAADISDPASRTALVIIGVLGLGFMLQQAYQTLPPGVLAQREKWVERLVAKRIPSLTNQVKNVLAARAKRGSGRGGGKDNQGRGGGEDNQDKAASGGAGQPDGEEIPTNKLQTLLEGLLKTISDSAHR